VLNFAHAKPQGDGRYPLRCPVELGLSSPAKGFAVQNRGGGHRTRAVFKRAVCQIYSLDFNTKDFP
jgi:hypothetical protein